MNTHHPRLALIEAVRGLSAVMVVFSHTIEKSGWFYTYIFDPGKIGVVVFFFISGYLVIPSAARDGSARNFLIKRLFRLYPMYWLSLLLALATWPHDFSPAVWVANITMAQQLMGYSNTIDVYWTLTIEVVLYTLITAILLTRPRVLINRFGRLTVLLGAACLAAAALRWGFQVRLPVAVPLGLFCMFIGARMRYLLEVGAPVSGTTILYVCVIVPACWMAYSFATDFNETPSRYIVSYLAGGVIFLAVMRRPHLDLGRSLNALGAWSFGIYLVHMLVISWLEPVLGRSPALFAMTLLLSALIAAPLYHFYERPLAALGHRLVRR